MAKVIDLNTLVKDDLTIRLLDGQEVVIPGHVSVEFVLKMSKLQMDLEKATTENEQYNVVIDIVTLILQQDTSKNITKKYIKENLSDIRMLYAIMEAMTEHISEIASDENL